MNEWAIFACLVAATVVAFFVAMQMHKWVKPSDAGKLAAQQHKHAERMALNHRALAEEHAAMADMFDAQAKRLDAYGMIDVGKGFKVKGAPEDVERIRTIVNNTEAHRHTGVAP